MVCCVVKPKYVVPPTLKSPITTVVPDTERLSWISVLPEILSSFKISVFPCIVVSCATFNLPPRYTVAVEFW